MGKGKKIKARSSHKVILKIKLKPLHLINNIVAVAEVTVVVVVFVVVGVVVFVGVSVVGIAAAAAEFLHFLCQLAGQKI